MVRHILSLMNLRALSYHASICVCWEVRWMWRSSVRMAACSSAFLVGGIVWTKRDPTNSTVRKYRCPYLLVTGSGPLVSNFMVSPGAWFCRVRG